MLSEPRARQLLQPFDLPLTAPQLTQTLTYLELLLRWNRRINLTAISNPDECLTRHFGESLFLARALTLEGSLLDVGSGAGFPGLALKILFPALAVTLLEPVAKKRAFLKEAARACAWDRVEVRPERLQQYAAGAAGRFDVGTVRALGRLPETVRELARCLKPSGHMCLWLGRGQVEGIGGPKNLKWQSPLSIPLSERRVIMIGKVGQ